MRITFLGTGTGIPQINKNPSSILIEIKNNKIVFDFGEGIMKSLIKKKIKINDLDALFLTHFHIDHIAGLVPLLFAYRYPAELRKKDFYVFGPKGTEKLIKNLFKTHGEQIRPLSYKLIIKEIEPDKIFYLRKIKIKAFKTKHTKESIGFIIFENKKKVIYTGDTDYDERYKKIFNKAELLITECSVPVDVEGHLSPEKILKIDNKIKVGKIAFIHLYPVINRKKIELFFKRELKNNFIIPSELNEITI